MQRRVFYSAGGSADLIAAHHYWLQGIHNPTEVSITFSSQIEDYCRDIGAKAYLVSMHPEQALLHKGDFTLEHRPKRSRSGLAFHIGQIRYGIGLLRTARAFGADVALLDSGTTPFFAMTMFRWFGIPVVPVLHNTLWPSGFRSRRKTHRVIEWLDAQFWKRVPVAAIAVSPEAERQVDELAPSHPPIFQMRPQFLPEYFASIPPPPGHGARPFQMLFVGRIDEIKGVLDIPAMARWIEDRSPGLVKWVICGRGRHFDDLVAQVAACQVGYVVEVRGWTSLDELREVYARSHAAIVPTRSLFSEGLAMTAVEAILAGRPIVTNPIVPALELLGPAAVAARSNSPESHAEAVMRLATDEQLYERLRSATAGLRDDFYDRSLGLTAVLHRALAPLDRRSGEGVAGERQDAPILR